MVPPVERSLGRDGADAPKAPVKSQTTQIQTGAADPNIGASAGATGVASGGASSPSSSTLAKPNVAESSDPTGVAASHAAPSNAPSPASPEPKAAQGAASPEPENAVRDRKGKVVLDKDGKPVTYGGDGQLTNVQLYEMLNQSQEPTPEERKREKREKMFAAIGDGISALSNLYFTTKGAPNMYSPRETQGSKVASYWEKIRQDREAARRRYVDGYMKAWQADSLAAIRKQNADAQQAAKEAEAKRKDDLASAQGEVFKARAAKDAAATALSEKTLEYMNSYGWPLKQAKAQAEIDLLKARTDQSEASAAKQRASAGGKSGSGKSGGKSGSGKSGGKYYGTFNDVAYKTKADYDRAVVSYANENKIPLTYDKASTDKYGRRRTTQANRTIAGLASAGEARYRASHPSKAPAAKAPVKATPKVAAAKPAAAKAPVKKTYANTKKLGL